MVGQGRFQAGADLCQHRGVQGHPMDLAPGIAPFGAMYASRRQLQWPGESVDLRQRSPGHHGDAMVARQLLERSEGFGGNENLFRTWLQFCQGAIQIEEEGQRLAR